MDKPWELNGENVLVLSDAHQRIDWVQAVLERENGNFDKFLFNGDMMDTHCPHEVPGAKPVGKFYNWLLSNHHVNLGNHELPVMESRFRNKVFSKKKNLFYHCSGFTNNRSIDFNKGIELEQWKTATIFRVVNGWLVSHAGFHPKYFMPFMSLEENLSRLWTEAKQALELMHIQFHNLFTVGGARSGAKHEKHIVGGPLWLDWSNFIDELPLPQLVGHTHKENTIRKIGRSYNIDTGSAYALISKDGAITFKSLIALKTKDENGNKIWVESDPKIE